MNTTMPGFPAAEEVRLLTAHEIDFVSGGAYGLTLPNINVNVGGPTVNVGNQIALNFGSGSVNQVQAIGNNLFKSILFAVA